MKISVLSESPADEDAIYRLAEAVLGQTVERVAPRRQRPGGVAGVIAALPAVIREIHFHTDADALIVVVDSDDTPVHESQHEQRPQADCRFCRLMQTVRSLQLPGRSSSKPLQIGVGVAVPAIEAWYLCGTDPHIVEAPFVRAAGGGLLLGHERNKLKMKVYGTERPSIALQKTRAALAIARIAPQIRMLEMSFPRGFGRLAEEMRGWT